MSADLLLHPVRLRILRAFLGDRALTTSDLRRDLPDVPPASLYRHVAKLADAGVLSVASQRRVRGAVERTYVLPGSAGRVSAGHVEKMSREDHRRAFMTFVGGLLGDFDRYLERDEVDPARDGMGYNLNGLWLSDAELEELVEELDRVLGPRVANGPGHDRRRRILSTIMVPADDASP